MGNGMTTSLIVNRLSIRDHHNQRLEATARGPKTATGQVGGLVYNPTARRIIGQEEIDKQNDDNLTFMFEYRSLINSRLQTLITALSNALASDLDVAMNASSPRWGNDRSAMSGNTIPTTQDAGAARVSYNYMMGWYSGIAGINTVASEMSNAFVSPAEGVSWTLSAAQASGVVSGTTTLASYSKGGAANAGQVDTMNITLSKNSTFAFTGANSDTSIGAGHNVVDASFEASPLAAQSVAAGAKNLVEKVLYDSLASIEYRSVLTSGLFKNIIISASSSLPTGSQAQASLNLNYVGSDDGGTNALQIKCDKFTAFYHS